MNVAVLADQLSREQLIDLLNIANQTIAEQQREHAQLVADLEGAVVVLGDEALTLWDIYESDRFEKRRCYFTSCGDRACDGLHASDAELMAEWEAEDHDGE